MPVVTRSIIYVNEPIDLEECHFNKGILFSGVKVTKPQVILIREKTLSAHVHESSGYQRVERKGKREVYGVKGDKRNLTIGGEHTV